MALMDRLQTNVGKLMQAAVAMQVAALAWQDTDILNEAAVRARLDEMKMYHKELATQIKALEKESF